MTAPDSEFAPFDGMYPEDEVPYMGIRIVATFGEGGEPLWHSSIGGDMRLGAVLGLVEMFKHWALTESFSGE